MPGLIWCVILLQDIYRPHTLAYIEISIHDPVLLRVWVGRIKPCSMWWFFVPVWYQAIAYNSINKFLYTDPLMAPDPYDWTLQTQSQWVNYAGLWHTTLFSFIFKHKFVKSLDIRVMCCNEHLLINFVVL